MENQVYSTCRRFSLHALGPVATTLVPASIRWVLNCRSSLLTGPQAFSPHLRPPGPRAPLIARTTPQPERQATLLAFFASPWPSHSPAAFSSHLRAVLPQERSFSTCRLLLSPWGPSWISSPHRIRCRFLGLTFLIPSLTFRWSLPSLV